jgi:hypothetical protein
MSTHDTLRERLLVRAGLSEPVLAKYTLADLERSEWSLAFERLMRNRLIMGALRYGRIHEPGKRKYNRVESMARRLAKYHETGNKELLVDVANLCLLEFEECHHPNAHFHSVDNTTEHVK